MALTELDVGWTGILFSVSSVAWVGLWATEKEDSGPGLSRTIEMGGVREETWLGNPGKVDDAHAE